LVVAALKAKYMPDDVITKVELRQMLGKVKMKKDEEPLILFEQLSTVKNRCKKPGEQIPDNDFIAAVLTAAPKEYMLILTTEQQNKGRQLYVNGFGVSRDSALVTNSRNVKYS
jgi:hypothetical protein